MFELIYLTLFLFNVSKKGEYKFKISRDCGVWIGAN